MTDAWGRLHVEVLEDEIIITLPFTNYDQHVPDGLKT
jgi:hypothetical protein